VMDEEALIVSVLRLRLNGESVAQVAALLEQEGTSVPLSQVKRACSKAAKRTPAAPAAVPAAAPPAPDGASTEKKEAKKAKAVAAMMKSAESAMLETQRQLKLAKDPDEINAQVPRHAMEGFIQRQTKLAIGGILGPGDAAVLRERIEADIAMLEWLKLAAAGGELAFKEDVMALGGELQLQRLKEKRGARNLTEVRAMYVDETQAVVDTEGNVDYAGVDRMLAREDALAPGTETGGADPMDDVD